MVDRFDYGARYERRNERFGQCVQHDPLDRAHHAWSCRVLLCTSLAVAPDCRSSLKIGWEGLGADTVTDANSSFSFTVAGPILVLPIMKKYIFSVAVILGSLGLPLISHAMVYFQSSSTATSSLINVSTQTGSTFFSAYTQFSPSLTIPTGTDYEYWAYASGTNPSPDYYYLLTSTTSSSDPYPSGLSVVDTDIINPSNTSFLHAVTGTLSSAITVGKSILLGVSANGPNNIDEGVGFLGSGSYSVNHNGSSQHWSFDSLPYFCLATTFAECGSSSPPSPTISLTYPINGSSIRDFGAWLVNVSTTDSSSYQGTTEVVYYGGYGSSTFQDFGSFAQGISSVPTPVIKSTLLNPIINVSATSTWYAQPFYVWRDSSGTEESTSGTIISFFINPQSASSSPTSTLGVLNPFLPVTSSSASSTVSNPYVCSGITDIGNCVLYVIYNAAQFLFVPNVAVTSYLSQSVIALQNAPPFSGVFQTLSAVQSAASSSPTGADLSVPWSFGSSSGTIPILNANTLASSTTPAGKTILFDLEDAVFDILVLGLIFFVPWHWWHKKHSQIKS